MAEETERAAERDGRAQPIGDEAMEQAAGGTLIMDQIECPDCGQIFLNVMEFARHWKQCKK